jgi:hypothetical protein
VVEARVYASASITTCSFRERRFKGATVQIQLNNVSSGEGVLAAS